MAENTSSIKSLITAIPEIAALLCIEIIGVSYIKSTISITQMQPTTLLHITQLAIATTAILYALLQKIDLFYKALEPSTENQEDPFPGLPNLIEDKL